MSATVAAWVMGGLLCLAGCLWAVENPGAPQMELEGGTSGKVPFPHLAHQKALSDCNACHGTFPQQAGAIEALKAEGTLKKKEVMNKLCIKCHREKKNAGEKSGPLTCTTCHGK